MALLVISNFGFVTLDRNFITKSCRTVREAGTLFGQETYP